MIVALVALLAAFMFLIAPPPARPAEFGNACVIGDTDVEMAASQFAVSPQDSLPLGYEAEPFGEGLAARRP